MKVNCFIIENDEDQRITVEKELREKLKPEFDLNVATYDDIEQCLEGLRNDMVQPPHLVLADLYRSEKNGLLSNIISSFIDVFKPDRSEAERENKDVRKIYKVIKEERIKRLQELRKELDQQCLLIVVSKYTGVFYKTFGEEGTKMSEEISQLLKFEAKVDLIVSKFEMWKGYQEIKDLLHNRYPMGANV